MKKILSAVLALLLVAAVPFAGLAETKTLLPYEGEEVVYKGLWDEYTATWDTNVNTDFPINEYFKAEYGNVRIEWDPVFGDARQKMDLMMATGDIVDIMVTVNMFDRYKKYDMSYYLDLSQYADYIPNITAAYDNYPSLDVLKGENGEIYWMPQQVLSDHLGTNYFVHQEALDALGLETPETWEDCMAAMRAYKEANSDKYPWLNPYDWGLSTYLSEVGYSFGYYYGSVYYDADAGEWKYPLLEEEAGTKEIVSALAQMYAEGLIAPDSFTRTTDQGNDVLRSGDWLFLFDYTEHPFLTAFKASEEIPFSIVPMKTPAKSEGELGTLPVTYHAGMYNYDGGVVSADVENPELMCSLVDSWQSEKMQVLSAYGVEGLTYELDDLGNRRYINEYTTAEGRDAFGINKNIEVNGMFKYVWWQPVMLPAREASTLGLNEKAIRTLLSWLENDEIAPCDNPYSVSLSDEAKEVVSANLTPIKTYVDEMLYQFVEGTRSMDEWDAFVQEALSYGDIELVLDAYNNGQLLAYSTEYHWMDMPKDW